MGPRIAIVGGGISGLSCAWYLAKSGISPVIIEARPRLGGVIQTERVDGCVIEAGPDSFLSVKPAAVDLIREVGLAGDIIGSNDHLRKTYVWKGGRLVALPPGLPPGIVATCSRRQPLRFARGTALRALTALRASQNGG